MMLLDKLSAIKANAEALNALHSDTKTLDIRFQECVMDINDASAAAIRLTKALGAYVGATEAHEEAAEELADIRSTSHRRSGRT